MGYEVLLQTVNRFADMKKSLRHTFKDMTFSMRSRYLLVATMFALFLTVAAILGQLLVENAARSIYQNTSGRTQVRSLLLDISTELRETERNLQEYLIVPDKNRYKQIIETLDEINSDIPELANIPWIAERSSVKGNTDFSQHITRLATDLRNFQNEVKKLMDIRRNNNKLFPVIQGSISPLSVRIWKHLEALQVELTHSSRTDISRLSNTAGNLSDSGWVIAVFGIGLAAFGFFLIEYLIRRPLESVVSALKAESRGLSNAPLPQTSMKETRELVEAFDEMRRQVRSRQQRLEAILDNAAEGILTFDSNGIIKSVNNAAEHLFGYTEKDLVGENLSVIIPPTDIEVRTDYMNHFIRNEIERFIGHEGEVMGRTRKGVRFPMALKVSSMLLEGNKLYTGLVADISERKTLVENLKHMAEHDGLTGLYNRSFFQEQLERTTEQVNRGKAPEAALLYLDLDNFKYVNDTLGHAAGDQLLLQVAGILSKRCRKSDVLARFGGDEFTILLNVASKTTAIQVAEAFRKQLADYSFKQAGSEIDVGCSIGVTLITQQNNIPAQIVSQADLACHLAKRGGRNRIHLYNPENERDISTMSLDMGWSRRIKNAIEQNKFVLVCQPIIKIRSKTIDSYEILIRMLDDDNETVLPGGFLPSAERFGLAAEIDRWVVVHAIDALAEQRKKTPELNYAINLSGATLTDTSICDLIQSQLVITGLPPSTLTFEVTETVAIADMAAAERILLRLQQMGCKTSLDDFGTGMSSFAYLRDLPVDIVKIDGRFVKNIAENPVDLAMVKALNDIAHALGKQTVAEFVEDEACLQILIDIGVDYAQGYYFGQPEAVTSCETIIDNCDVPELCEKHEINPGSARSGKS